MIELEAYNIAKRQFSNLQEIKGPTDNPVIVTAHKLTKVFGDNEPRYADEIPWCSSFMNLMLVLASIKRNPGRVLDYLRGNNVSEETIKEIFYLAGMPSHLSFPKSENRIPAITFSAAAASWRTWGKAVPLSQARRGDICVLSRKGGHHVAFLDEEKPGKLLLTLFGGNQANKVCSANWYLKTNLITVRRHDI